MLQGTAPAEVVYSYAHLRLTRSSGCSPQGFATARSGTVRWPKRQLCSSTLTTASTVTCGSHTAGLRHVLGPSFCVARARSRVRQGLASVDYAGTVSAFQTIDELESALRAVDYLPDRGLSTALFLALALEKPLLLEGEAGVGKTEAAKSLATAMGARLIRLAAGARG